jgi:DNA-binding transcriptional ArsR family regulator
MVKYNDIQLDRTFGALADQTRRAILDRLEREDRVSISELARPFTITLPGVMKHLGAESEESKARRKGR